MGYRITKLALTRHVLLQHDSTYQTFRTVDGFVLAWGTDGMVTVTRPEWDEVFHIGPSLILAITTEPLPDQEPAEVTKVARRGRLKEAA